MPAPKAGGVRLLEVGMLRRHFKYVRPYRHLAGWAFLLLLLVTALSLSTPFVLRDLVDRGVLGRDFAAILLLSAVYFAVEVSRMAADSGQNYVLKRLGQHSTRDLRTEVFRHLQRVDLRLFHETPAGEIVSGTTNDVGAVADLFSSGVVILLRDGLLIVGSAAVLLALDPGLGLMTLSFAPIFCLVTFLCRRQLRNLGRRAREAVSAVNDSLEENITGMKVIRLFGLERLRQEHFSRASDQWLRASVSSIKTHAVFGAAISVAMAIAVTMLWWMGGDKVLRGGITVGVLVAYMQLVPNFLGPVRDLAEKMSALQSGFAAAERVFRILDMPAGLAAPSGAKPAPSTRGLIRVSNLRFGYGDGPEVLHGIDLDVAAGERVALVGKTGAGKTTLARILARLYDPRAGAVFIDGRNVRDVPLPELRRRVALVPQGVFIFADSVLENVRLGDPSIHREDVIEACRLANAHTFVERLTGGYDHVLAEAGRGLSAGERQLIAFARALARSPSVVILDEPTASVDPLTERLMRDAFERTMKGRTAIIIAHRKSTVRGADRVVVLDDGRIVEEGSPSQLLSRGGRFQRMCSDRSSVVGA